MPFIDIFDWFILIVLASTVAAVFVGLGMAPGYTPTRGQRERRCDIHRSRQACSRYKTGHAADDCDRQLRQPVLIPRELRR